MNIPETSSPSHKPDTHTYQAHLDPERDK